MRWPPLPMRLTMRSTARRQSRPQGMQRPLCRPAAAAQGCQAGEPQDMIQCGACRRRRGRLLPRRPAAALLRRRPARQSPLARPTRLARGRRPRRRPPRPPAAHAPARAAAAHRGRLPGGLATTGLSAIRLLRPRRPRPPPPSAPAPRAPQRRRAWSRRPRAARAARASRTWATRRPSLAAPPQRPRRGSAWSRPRPARRAAQTPGPTPAPQPAPRPAMRPARPRRGSPCSSCRATRRPPRAWRRPAATRTWSSTASAPCSWTEASASMTCTGGRDPCMPSFFFVRESGVRLDCATPCAQDVKPARLPGVLHRRARKPARAVAEFLEARWGGCAGLRLLPPAGAGAPAGAAWGDADDDSSATVRLGARISCWLWTWAQAGRAARRAAFDCVLAAEHAWCRRLPRITCEGHQRQAMCGVRVKLRRETWRAHGA